MGRYVFKLPDVGEGTTEAEIAKWHVAVGDRIEEDQPLVDVTTDQAVVEIPAPVSGTVVSIYGAAGETVAVGSDLVELEVAGGENAEATLVEAKPKATASAQRSGTVDAAQTAGITAAPATGAAFATRAAGERPAASPAVLQRVPASSESSCGGCPARARAGESAMPTLTPTSPAASRDHRSRAERRRRGTGSKSTS